MTLYPLGGKITVDNEPPAAKTETARLVAVAYDAGKPDAKANSSATAFVKPNGSFEFPPLPPGKYVMLFAELRYNSEDGVLRSRRTQESLQRSRRQLEKTGVLIDLQAPGKTDYAFNLSVAGETPPATAGPKAFVGSGPRGASRRK